MTNAARRALPAALSLSVLACAVPAALGATAAPPLRTDGFGPLKLGMSQSKAVATGWLGDRGTGCELGGPPLPVTYSFTGPKAPAGVKGTAEFTKGRLRTLSFTKGVTTTKGVTVGTSTIAQMLTRYRTAPFSASARFDSTFQGTFVSVRRGTRFVMGGFGEKNVVTIVGIPAVPLCE